MALNFKNKLNKEVDAYFKYEKPKVGNVRRGVGRGTTGKPISKVPQGGGLPIDLSGIGKEFELHIEMEEIPVKNGVKGVKVFPGSGLGHSHHVEFHDRGDKYLAVIHYQRGKGDKVHIDPEVHHPEPPDP